MTMHQTLPQKRCHHRRPREPRLHPTMGAMVSVASSEEEAEVAGEAVEEAAAEGQVELDVASWA